MTRPRLLVVSVVHHADDARIREKTIRTLAPDWDVVYRTRPPAPTDSTGLGWKPIGGGRIVRNLRALSALLAGDYDVGLIHDPELVPAAVIARLARRRRIVFDVHEHVPGQVSTKEWVPARRMVARLVGWVLRAAEPILDITLAEAGYRDLFASAHPIFPNHPDPEGMPVTLEERRPEIVYVGSVTEQRGIPFLVDATPLGVELVIIGPCDPNLEGTLRDRAERRGVTLHMLGRLPHRLAMERAAQALVGVSPLLDTPNYRNSLPTKVLEYLALGLLVVASDLPGTRAVVAGEPGVRLVPPGDAAAWTEALDGALRGAEEFEHGSQRHEVRNRWRWPAEEVRAFYEGLLAD